MEDGDRLARRHLRASRRSPSAAFVRRCETPGLGEPPFRPFLLLPFFSPLFGQHLHLRGELSFEENEDSNALRGSSPSTASIPCFPRETPGLSSSCILLKLFLQPRWMQAAHYIGILLMLFGGALLYRFVDEDLAARPFHEIFYLQFTSLSTIGKREMKEGGTAGYGNIVPHSDSAKYLFVLHVFPGIALMILVLSDIGTSAGEIFLRLAGRWFPATVSLPLIFNQKSSEASKEPASSDPRLSSHESRRVSRCECRP